MTATIPRQPGVTEGVWDRADRIAVQEALVDSQQASTSGRNMEAGEPAMNAAINAL